MMSRKTMAVLCGVFTVAAGCTHTAESAPEQKSTEHPGHEAAQVTPSVMVPFESLEWKEAFPGSPLTTATLWGNPEEGAYGMYLKLPAGFKADIHAHTHDYYGILVSGVWEHWDAGQKKPTQLSPGSYVMQPGGEHHGDSCAKGDDCVVLLVQKDKRDYITIKKKDVKAPKMASKMVDMAKVSWSEAAPGSPLQVSPIWGNPAEGEYGMYLKLPAGFEPGLHSHTGAYHGVLLSGTWEHWDAGAEAPQSLSPGSYVMQPGGSPHGDRCASETPCVILLAQDQKNDFIPFESK